MLPVFAAAILLVAADSPAQPQSPEPTSQIDHAFGSVEPSSSQELEHATAREDLGILAQSRQAATVASSSVNGTSTTGQVAVSDQAFQNASGLTLVNINTGNNVAMNASMNVNVVINPRP